MYKSLFAFILICAAGAGAYYLLGTMDSSDSPVNERLSQSPPVSGEVSTSINTPPKQEKIPRPKVAQNGPFPRVVIGETVYPFGRMEIGQTNEHIFELRNEGDADLELSAGETTCKCTTFGFGADPKTSSRRAVVKPGEKVQVVIGWKSGDAPNRSFRHGGSVFTNDPMNTEINYAVEGSIEVSFELLPQTWAVGNMFAGQPATFRGSIASKVHSEFEIESATSTSGKVSVTWDKMSLDMLAQDTFMSGWTFNTEISSDIPVGIFEDTIEIRIKGRPDPLKVPLTARKHGLIRLQQMSGTVYDADKALLQLGSFSPRDGREAKLLLIVDQKDMAEPFQLKEKEADPSFVTATLEPLGQPTGTVHRYILKVTVPPGRPQAHKTLTNPGYIDIATNHPSGEAIKMALVLYSR
ncbi:MAG: DUF1573 domain-containing protein [Planctomycetota bacterium]